MGTLISILKKFINSDFTKPLNTLIDEVKATLALIKAKTDTITADLFTATHASRLDANISSRQASWGATTTHSSRIDASISSRASQASVDAIYSKVATPSGNVKSIQRGQLLSASTQGGTNYEKSYVDIAISPVNISKCVIFTEVGFSSDTSHAACVAKSGSNYMDVFRGLAKLTSPTNLRVHSTFGTSSYFVHGSWTIVEYY